MSYIEELRQRVESAERRFGLIDEQERRYSERLIDLMNALETAQTEKQTEAAAHKLRIAELERENGELRGMLHALLLGVEAGSRDTLAGTLRDLDSRLSDLLGAAPAPAVETDEAAGLDTVSLGAEIEDAVAATETEIDTADEAPGAAAPGLEIAPETAVDEEIAAEAPPVEEMAAEETAAEDIAAEEVVVEDVAAEDVTAEDAPAAGVAEEDAVAAAEQAVAALVADDAEPVADAMAGDEMAPQETAEIAPDPAADEVAQEPAADEMAAETAPEEHHGGMPPSPVAEMIVRLSEETQYFPEPDAEAMAEEPAPAPKPKATRKKA